MEEKRYIVFSVDYTEITTGELKAYATQENIEVLLDADSQEATVIAQVPGSKV